MQCSQSSCSQPTTGLLGAPRAVPTSTSPPTTPPRPRCSTSDPRGPSPAAAGHHHRLSSCPSLRRLTPQGPDRPPAPPRAPTRPRRGPRRPPARPRAEAPSLGSCAAASQGLTSPPQPLSGHRDRPPPPPPPPDEAAVALVDTKRHQMSPNVTQARLQHPTYTRPDEVEGRTRTYQGHSYPAARAPNRTSTFGRVQPNAVPGHTRSDAGIVNTFVAVSRHPLAKQPSLWLGWPVRRLMWHHVTPKGENSVLYTTVNRGVGAVPVARVQVLQREKKGHTDSIDNTKPHTSERSPARR